MNLDDFINSDDAGTPAGLGHHSPLDTSQQGDERPSHSTATAIPIKGRKEPLQQHFVPQSVPVAAHQRMQDEFGYIPRHQRKTSIDETGQRVSVRPSFSFFCSFKVSSWPRGQGRACPGLRSSLRERFRSLLCFALCQHLLGWRWRSDMALPFSRPGSAQQTFPLILPPSTATTAFQEMAWMLTLSFPSILLILCITSMV